MTADRTSVTVIAATYGDAVSAGMVIGNAFCAATVSPVPAALPQAFWLSPDDQELRRTALCGQFAMIAEHAINGAGQVLLAVSGEAIVVGAAIVLYPDKPPVPADYDERLAELAGPQVKRFRQLDATLQSHHPACVEPFVHLALMGVDARFRGGVGTLLLHAVHDRFSQGIYVEAATQSLAEGFYAPFGYEQMPPFRLPDNGPAFWPMRRPAGKP